MNRKTSKLMAAVCPLAKLGGVSPPQVSRKNDNRAAGKAEIKSQVLRFPRALMAAIVRGSMTHAWIWRVAMVTLAHPEARHALFCCDGWVAAKAPAIPSRARLSVLRRTAGPTK